MAHRILLLISIFSRSIHSSSVSTRGSVPVFSPTSIKAIIRGSKYFECCLSVSETESHWSRFERISSTIINSFGFLTCFCTMEKAVFKSIPELRKFESFWINIHISFGPIQPITIAWLFFCILLFVCFFPLDAAARAIAKSSRNFVLSNVPSSLINFVFFLKKNISVKYYRFYRVHRPLLELQLRNPLCHKDLWAFDISFVIDLQASVFFICPHF